MTPEEFNTQRRRKNWILLGLLLALFAILYGMSMVRFGQTLPA